MKQINTVTPATENTDSTARTKFNIRIPTTGSDGNPMTFIHVISDTEWKNITRKEFLKLVRSVADANDHVVPDIEGAIMYFVPDGEKYAQMSRTFCREAEKDRKRNIRHHECVYKNTAQCDGWTDNPERECNCATCDRNCTGKTISLEEMNTDDEGNVVDFGSAYHDDTVPSMEELAQERIDADMLRSALAHLNDDDRKFLNDGIEYGLNKAKLARSYDINPRSAGRRFERIKRQLCKDFINK